MNKQAAEKIASHYYQLGAQLALRNAGLSKSSEYMGNYDNRLQDTFYEQEAKRQLPNVSLAPLDPRKFESESELMDSIARKSGLASSDVLDSAHRNIMREANRIRGGYRGRNNPVSFNRITGHSSDW